MTYYDQVVFLMGIETTLVDRTKLQMNRLGWSNSALARKTGFSVGYVSKLLRPGTRWNTDVINQVAAALGVSPGWLAGGDQRSSTAAAIPLDDFVDAVQRNDAVAIGRAFTAMMLQVPPRAPDGDPIRAKLIQAYDRRDWRTIMQISGKLADQWG